MDNLLQKIIESNSNPDLIKRAFEFAKNAHKDQKRFSGEDYISHPLMVAYILSEMKLDSETIVAALLHDVLEKTTTSPKEVEKEFGKDISSLVEGVSKVSKIQYPAEKLKIKPHNINIEKLTDIRAENLRKMFVAISKDLRVVLIKLADRLHNMRTLNYLPIHKQKRIALETLEIFAPLANRLGMGKIKGELEDLAFPYLYPREYKWIIKKVREKYKTRMKYLKKVKNILNKILNKKGVRPIDIHFRAKHYWSLYQKFLKYNKDFEKIYDLVAIRIIVDDIESCYKALGIIYELWQPLPGCFDDYISSPTQSNYRALHTTCFCLDGKVVEIQIKTMEMHQEAEYGIAAHWIYKEQIGLKIKKKKFAWITQLCNWQKEISGSQEFFKRLKVDFLKDRIFVFTPKGDVIDLPEGACSIDFAYAIHHDIGHRCVAAKVNKKIAPLLRPLKNEDVVEIIVDKNKNPSRDWLEFVKTKLARSEIKKWLKKKSDPENLKQGIELLNQVFQEMGKISWNREGGLSPLSQDKKEMLLKIFPFKNIQDLEIAVGKGKISPYKIFRSLFKEKKSKVLSRVTQKTLSKVNENAIISVAGETNILINLMKCCMPKTGAKIRAYITKLRGASIHKIDCENLKRMQKKHPEKIIEASWVKKE